MKADTSAKPLISFVRPRWGQGMSTEGISITARPTSAIEDFSLTGVAEITRARFLNRLGNAAVTVCAEGLVGDYRERHG